MPCIIQPVQVKSSLTQKISGAYFQKGKPSARSALIYGRKDIKVRIQPSSTIRMYATRERKLRKEAGQGNGEKIERRWLIKLLYKPADQVKGISQEQFDQVIARYPVIGKVYDVGKSFKEILFAKKPEDLESWIEECQLLGIEELDRFVNGIQRDKDAVKNAIQFDYNNGLAEGSINKLKVIKRIMYGRSSFELLKSKLLRLELKRKIN